jgi:hypothetical protein
LTPLDGAADDEATNVGDDGNDSDVGVDTGTGAKSCSHALRDASAAVTCASDAASRRAANRPVSCKRRARFNITSTSAVLLDIVLCFRGDKKKKKKKKLVAVFGDGQKKKKKKKK